MNTKNKAIILIGAVIVAIFALGVGIGFFLPEKQVGPSEDLSQVGGIYFIGERDFPDGISVDGTTVIDADGNIDAPITSTNGSFSGTLSVTGASTLTGAITAASNYTGSDGVISQTDATASTTLETDMLTLIRTHSDATTGADDGIGSCLEWMNENEDGNATTTAKICGVSSDTATSSQDAYLSFDIKTQNGYTYSEVMRLDEHGYLGLGTTTPDSKLTVLSTGTQMKFSYDASNYGTFAVGSGGDLTITPSGDGVVIAGSLDVGAFTQGGGVTATSTSNNAETLLATDFDTENRIEVTLNVEAGTYTLPASSTLSSFAPVAGDTREIIIQNATSTAIALTIAAGTGQTIHNATSTQAIPSGDFGKLIFQRKSNTDFDIFFDIFQ